MHLYIHPLPPGSQSPHLPLSLLPIQETLQQVNLCLQRLQPLPQVLRNNSLIIAELGVEILAVWARRHGGGEDWLDEEAVVWLERVAVCVAEGDGELVRGLEVGGDGEAGEFETTVSHLR